MVWLNNDNQVLPSYPDKKKSRLPFTHEKVPYAGFNIILFQLPFPLSLSFSFSIKYRTDIKGNFL